MSKEGNYSLFCEDPDSTIDLSWILKLVDQDVDGNTGNSSSSSSPERRDGSSGYSSGDSFLNKLAVNSKEASREPSPPYAEAVGYPWSDSPIFIPNGSGTPAESYSENTYHIFANQRMQQAHMEAEFFLQALTTTAGKELEPTSNFQASVIHSSGMVQSVALDKTELLPGYRCSFLPVAAGRYSASVYQDRKNFRRGRNITIHGSPLDMLISRNYSFESRSPVVENLYVGSGGSKYWGIATDKFSDMLYVTDRDSHEVIAMNMIGGKHIFRFGRNPTPNVESLFRPTGIVCDSVNRRLIICDKDNHRMVFLSLDGHFISAFGRKGHHNGEFNYPWDVDISPAGDLIVVSDSRNHRVQMFDRFGNYLRKFSVFETQPFEYKLEFDYPRGVTFDHEGKHIFVTDFNTHNVLSLSVNLSESKKLIPDGKMCRPQGITVDDLGNLLVCDSRRNCIRIVTPDGDLLSTVDRVGNYQLTVPSDTVILRGGRVAVVDIFGRIRVF